MSFVGLDDGYVRAGNSDAGPWVDFSKDGVEWTHQLLAGKPCSSESASQIGAATSNGREVVIVGRAGRADPCDIDDAHFAAWWSPDGAHWTAAPAASVGIQEFNPDALWWTPSGWHSDAGESPDGLTWQPIDFPLEPEIANGPFGFAGPDGTVLLRTLSDPERLHIGGDDRDWREMAFPAGCEGTVMITPPSEERNAWVLFGIDDATTCVSVDLAHWSRGRLGVPAECGIRALADTRFGIVATVDITALGAVCTAPGQYVSRDGLEWVPVKPDAERRFLIADGPAGVIGLSGFSDRPQTAWRLEE